MTNGLAGHRKGRPKGEPMKIQLTTVVVRIVRHDRYETVVVFDDDEYKIPHTDVRIKAHLLSLVPGSIYEARLILDTSAIVVSDSVESES